MSLSTLARDIKTSLENANFEYKGARYWRCPVDTDEFHSYQKYVHPQSPSTIVYVRDVLGLCGDVHVCFKAGGDCYQVLDMNRWTFDFLPKITEAAHNNLKVRI